MDGVTIVNTIPAVSTRDIPFGIMWAIFAAICLFVFVCGCKEKEIKAVLYGGVAFIATVGLTLVLLMGDVRPVQYWVTIAPETSMVEFMDKYEIVDRQGDVYIVIEKAS